MTVKPTTPNDATRDRALRLLRNGLASPSEVAEIAGESRQLVYYWIKSAGVDWQEARRARLDREWRKARPRRS